MKRRGVVALMLFALGLIAAASTCYAGDKHDTTRLVTGLVMDTKEAPLPKAVVYLTNTHTRATKSYIADDNGSYRFPALSPNIDYEIYAQYNGKKSDTKTVSQFDSRKQVNINLKIDTK